MQLNKLKIATITMVLAGISLMACEKKKEIIAPWDDAGANTRMAHLRVIHASPNFREVTNRADSLHIFAAGTKINGARFSYGGATPGTSPATYIALYPGIVDLKLSVGGLVNYDSIAVGTIRVKMDPGQFYSLVITDSILNGTKDSSRIFVRDSFPIPLQGRIGLRFMHTMVDTAGDKRVDVWSARRNNRLYSNIQPGTVTAFSNQPFINIPDTLIVRRAGTMTELARINTITFADSKVYTLYLRGNAAVATGTKARGLTWYLNR